MTDAEYILDELNEILTSRQVDIYEGSEPLRVFDMEVISWIRDYVNSVNPHTQITWDIPRGLQRISFTTSILHLVAHCCEQIQLFKILKNYDNLSIGLANDSYGNTLLHILIILNNFDVFELIYKNCYESISVKEIFNHDGHSLLNFINKSSNKSFIAIVNKYIKLETETEELIDQTVSTKDEFTNFLISILEFDQNSGYPFPIVDSKIMVDYLAENIFEFQFDEIIIQKYSLYFAHIMLIIGDNNLTEQMLERMPKIHLKHCFMLSDVYKNTILHYAAHFKNVSFLCLCFDYYLEFLTFPVNSHNEHIWDIIKDRSDSNHLLKYRMKYELMQSECDKYDLDTLLINNKSPEEILRALAADSILYDNRKDPIQLKVEDNFINWFMKLEDANLWDTVVYNVYNLRVSHLVFLTNKFELITQMLNNIIKDKLNLILNMKDSFNNTPLHIMAYFGNLEVIKFIFTTYEDSINVININAKKLTIGKIAQMYNYDELSIFITEYEKKYQDALNLAKYKKPIQTTNVEEPKQTKNENDEKVNSTPESKKQSIENEKPFMPTYDYGYAKYEEPMMPNYDYDGIDKYNVAKENEATQTIPLETPNVENTQPTISLETSQIENTLPTIPLENPQNENTQPTIPLETPQNENTQPTIPLETPQIKTPEPNPTEYPVEENPTPIYTDQYPVSSNETPETPIQNLSSSPIVINSNREKNTPHISQISETEEQNKHEDDIPSPSRPNQSQGYSEMVHPDVTANSYINYIIDTVSNLSLYSPYLQLVRVEDPQFIRSISYCLEHVKLNSLMKEPQLLFIHTILMTQKEDLIFYSLKKWELKDTSDYNIFELQESSGMDILSLLIMSGSLTMVRHLFDNYYGYLNFGSEAANSYVYLANESRQNHIYNYLRDIIEETHDNFIDGSIQRDNVKEDTLNEDSLNRNIENLPEESSIKEGEKLYSYREPIPNLRMSRSFHDTGFDQETNTQTLPKVIPYYNSRKRQNRHHIDFDDSDESIDSLADMYIQRLNKYQYKIEDLSYKYTKNLKKLNRIYNNNNSHRQNRTMYGQTMNSAYQTKNGFGDNINNHYSTVKYVSSNNQKPINNINPNSTRNGTFSHYSNTVKTRNKTQIDSVLPEISNRKY